MLQDNFQEFPGNPQDVYTHTQINMLDKVEGIHDKKPDKEALVISVSLSIIEAAVAFSMVGSAGIIVASMVALFPVVLLWAMANHHAEKAEIPEAYDELVDKYYETVQK
ncbi:MAG: hypothetical protein RMY30_029830 [Nostoc sp. CmiSLP01]|nr:hypothetical protein [Nostoc sp. CmiSLP01]MDZ8289063.1 hypothetical protein [Nostoc sp. ChiSLP01]